MTPLQTTKNWPDIDVGDGSKKLSKKPKNGSRKLLKRQPGKFEENSNRNNL